jgi:hypothetical protein
MDKAVAVLSNRVGISEPSGRGTPDRPWATRSDARVAAVDRARPRMGALALGLSAMLLGAFPLVRPFFRLDVFAAEATLTAAGRAITSAPWLIAHLMGMTGFILLLGAIPALYARLAAEGDAPRLFRAVALSIAGIALVLPMFGVETYALPAIGQIYLGGQPGIAPIITLIYRGLGTVVMLLGLLLLAVGALTFANVIWRRATLSRWAALMWAVGLAAWLPLLPRPIRVVDGLLIGIGGVWLARTMWRQAR